MIILVDADGVMENLTVELPAMLCERYGIDRKFEDITEWGFDRAFPELTYEQIYSVELEEELYERLRPIKGAPEYLRKLADDGHKIYVVTNTPYKAVAMKMENFMEKYYPFLTWNDFIVTSRKQLIKGDVLIDDGVHNLLGGDYIKLLFDAPINRSYDAKAGGMIRVNGWEEVYEAIKAIENRDKTEDLVHSGSMCQ